MAQTIADIAEALGTEVRGDASVPIAGAAEPASAGPSDLAIAMTPDYAEGLRSGHARAALVWDDADWQGFGLDAALVAPRPRYALAGVTRLLDAGPGIEPGRHPTAVIADDADIGDGAAIGPFVVIGKGARIGPRARIGAHVEIGPGSVIGADALLLGGVRISRGVTIGDRFIAQPGVVIGGDGFSFVTEDKSRAEAARETLGTDVSAEGGAWTRIHSLGGVEIGDDVEIGANSTIDAGTIRATRVGQGTKIDNLVQIGHNVVVGAHCLICAQSGVAGSTRIGDRVILGGHVGVSDNIEIGDDVVAGGGTKILSRVPAGRVVLGYPAMKMDQFVQAGQNWRRLPRLIDDVRALKKAVPKGDPSD